MVGAIAADPVRLLSAATGVEAGIVVYSGDSSRIRDNTITGIGRVSGYLANEGAIVVESSSQSRRLLDIRRNRLSGNVSGIVINRQSGDTLVPAVVVWWRAR